MLHRRLELLRCLEFVVNLFMVVVLEGTWDKDRGDVFVER
jgi:hypothetical protein